MDGSEVAPGTYPFMVSKTVAMDSIRDYILRKDYIVTNLTRKGTVPRRRLRWDLLSALGASLRPTLLAIDAIASAIALL